MISVTRRSPTSVMTHKEDDTARQMMEQAKLKWIIYAPAYEDEEDYIIFCFANGLNVGDQSSRESFRKRL